jgi:ABC-type transport system involved in multi-copper enzyme maturation permease subunit
MSLGTLVVGPLVVPECRRSAARGWPVLVRTLAGVAAGVIVVSVMWFWWFMLQFDGEYQPFFAVRACLTALEGLALTVAVVISPAVLAGSLAGEKERGALGLLLTTRVSAREIVLGRMAGRLSQVFIILLAAVPALVLGASLAGFRAVGFLLCLALPAAVAFGGGGIAVAASAISRRGRDALLVVYLLDLFFLLAPLVGLQLPASTVQDVLTFFSPYYGMVPLVWEERIGPALGSTAVWTAIGVIGTAIASWRLRPTCMAQTAGPSARHRTGRRWIVPPVGERPMYWKELYIERVGSLGRFGKWLGLLIVVVLLGGSTVFAALELYYLFVRRDPSWQDYITRQMSSWIGDSAGFIGFLLQWAIGLRAAVAISSERERGSWDALLTSPLEGGEIVVGKLAGSLFALRWLIGSALWAWTVAFLFDAMRLTDFLSHVAGVFIIGAFMAAIGVRTSLAAGTATRAMAITIGMWLAALITSAIVSLLLVGAGAYVCFIAWWTAVQLGWADPTRVPSFPLTFQQAFALFNLTFYGLATAMVVAEARLRFDRIAGRLAGGGVQVSVDQFLHGMPMEPVLVGPDPNTSAPSSLNGSPGRAHLEEAAADPVA